MSDFVHLHLHTEYSLLDGAVRIKDLLNYIKELGMNSIAITDHGNMFGTLKFAEIAKSKGIKAIIGCELYLCENYLKKDVEGEETDHLVLLCKNKKGYKNLIKLDSIAYVEGFYRKPRIDYKLLKEHSEGLICLSACLAGKIPKQLLRGDFEGAKQTALYLQDIFKDDFYIELQDHGIPEQKRVNPLLIKLAKEIGAEVVATNDAHYLKREDSEMQDVLLCMQMKKTIDDPTRMKFSTNEFYVKSEDEMRELFPNIEKAITNTKVIADKCYEECFDLKPNGDPIKDDSLIPGYAPPDGKTPYEYLSELTEEGLRQRYKTINKEIRDRTDYELTTIAKMGFLEYYLIVWDFINYAKSIGIPVGAGRGSGVGSIIAYAVGITDVDPLKYSLIFERFLNVERVSMPDFDIDFCNERRGEVIEYVRNKYGKDKVAQIVTFGTLAAKAAIKDVGRVYKVPYSEIDKVTKLMDGKSSVEETLGLKHNRDGQYVGVPEIIELYKNDTTIKKIIDMSIKVEGMPKNTSMHAAGVVICRQDISDNVPLQRNGDDVTTQFNMKEVEALGMLKMDFLALRTLTDIKKAKDYILEVRGVNVDFGEIGYENIEAYELIGEGETDAVFQLESPGMKKFMRELKPSNLEDIIAGISLYRPGPMDSIPKYIEYKMNPSKIAYKHSLLEPILTVTHGTIIYQEQVMQIVQQLAGFSLGQADIIRRAMGKKNVEEMARQKNKFVFGSQDNGENIEGAISRGVPEAAAADIFDEMANFAKYAFNKSHAAAYAVLAYQTAYLKKFYPHEFLAAVLNNRIDDIVEITKYVSYLREKNIKILPPDVNKSKTYFTVENNCVRFGLVALKGVGINAITSIIEERDKNGDYKNFEDFLLRSPSGVLNKRAVENMILSGVFDSFGIYRSKLMGVYEELLDRVNIISKKKETNQLSIFGELIKEDNTLNAVYPDIQEFSSKEKLIKEKAVLGLYVTGHPLESYKSLFDSFNFSNKYFQYYENDEEENKIFTEVENDQTVELCGIIASFSKITTKSNKNMAFVMVEDIYGAVECVVFPNVYEKVKRIIKDDGIVKVAGKLQIRLGEEPKIIVDNITDFEHVFDNTEIKEEKKEIGTLWLNITDSDKKTVEEITEILSSHTGEIPVKFVKGKQKLVLNSKINFSPALLNELSGFLNEENIKYITNK